MKKNKIQCLCISIMVIAVVAIAVFCLIKNPMHSQENNQVSNQEKLGESDGKDAKTDDDTKKAEEGVTKEASEEVVQEGKQEQMQEDKQEKLPKVVEMIEIQTPIITEDMISGADTPSLCFASKDRIIFHDYYGLFVYSLEEGMIGAVDLEPIGCQHTQGDKFCEIVASEDGMQVYLYVMGEEDMYVFDVEKNILFRQEYDEECMKGLDKIKNIYDCIEPDYTALRSGQCIPVDNGYNYLESGSVLPIDLIWIVSNLTEDGWVQTQSVSLFEGYEGTKESKENV